MSTSGQLQSRFCNWEQVLSILASRFNVTLFHSQLNAYGCDLIPVAPYLAFQCNGKYSIYSVQIIHSNLFSKISFYAIQDWLPVSVFGVDVFITLVITVHVSKTAVHLEIDDRHLFKFGFHQWSGYWAPVVYLGGKKLAFKVNPKFLCF